MYNLIKNVAIENTHIIEYKNVYENYIAFLYIVSVFQDILLYILFSLCLKQDAPCGPENHRIWLQPVIFVPILF